ncbi:ABC transporter ATP-binding protein [Flavisolibacter nicotianae]|uniref:ABC transporter ATP-binding protein n=1 Tax=Flavisolibacter nicotianae TaxID=2364882 RepID=UPI000EAF32B7|nr:ABC transporter ATP-binding protein [Flavisolibacter nicotianae]
MEKKNDKRPSPKGKPGLFGLLKPYKGMASLLLLFALLSNGINLWVPKIIAQAIDDYASGSFVLKAVIFRFLAAALCIFVFTSLQTLLQTYASEKVARDLRSRLSEKISRQSYASVQQANPAKLLTNLTSDVDSIKLFVSQAIVSLFSSLFIIIGASVLLVSINWKLGLAVLSIIPILGGTFFVVLRKVRVLFKKGREIIDWLNRIITENIFGAALIRVFNSQQLEYTKFLSASSDAKEVGIGILKLFAALIPVINLVANLSIVTILALGGHFVINGTMTLGELAAFNNYIFILIFPIIIIGFMSSVMAQASASYQRIRFVLEAPDVEEKGVVKDLLKGNIDVQNLALTFGEKQALKNISFSVKAGTKTAIIGPTAAGKTQLLYLLTGLIQPTSGIIAYDGININSYEKESLHNQVGFVFQDSVLFNLSIRENIAFSNTVTDDLLQKAIATSELADLIERLPQGLDTVVAERGTSLSGGQKQRLMLARALAVNPKILLLDDFTARVDTRTEQKILENVQANYEGITLVSVTQKIASVEHFDQIILLMEGELIAAGTHETLLNTCPEYVQLYQSQRSTSQYELQS